MITGYDTAPWRVKVPSLPTRNGNLRGSTFRLPRSPFPAYLQGMEMGNTGPRWTRIFAFPAYLQGMEI